MSYWWADGLLNLLFPPECLLCRKRLNLERRKNSLCDSCGKSFSPAGWFCLNCGMNFRESRVCCGAGVKSTSKVGAIFALSRFEDRWRSVIHRFKYFGKSHLAESMGALIGEGIIESGGADNIEMVTAIPLHPEKERERGYNQSELLAVAVAKTLDLPYISLLMRVRNTVSQISLSGKERKENMRGAFIYKSKVTDVKRSNILLVDDVYTTGATMVEAGKVLADAGADVLTGAVAAFQQR